MLFSNPISMLTSSLATLLFKIIDVNAPSTADRLTVKLETFISALSALLVIDNKCPLAV